MAPLTVEETAELAAQVAARQCDPAFLNGLYQATKGNPLFVVESVRLPWKINPPGVPRRRACRP